MAKYKEHDVEQYLTDEQLDYILSLPEEERNAATEKILGIRRFDNGAVDLTTIPGKKGDFYRKKQLLLSPEQVRDEEGLTLKRSDEEFRYITATCPFCGTTTEQEGSQYRYSKKTKKLIARDVIITVAIIVASFLKILNVFIALIAVTLAITDMSKHTKRKMYYTVRCRKCQAHFPLDEKDYEELCQQLKAEGKGIYAKTKEEKKAEAACAESEEAAESEAKTCEAETCEAQACEAEQNAEESKQETNAE